MKNRRPVVYPFRVQPHAVAINGLTDSQVGKYFRDLLRDLDRGEGTTDEAQAMITHSQLISSVRKMAGLASAKARLGLTDDPNSVSGTRPQAVPRGTSAEPALEHVLAHAADIGLPEAEARAFFKYWAGAKWAENDGKPVLNWRKKLVNWKTKYEQDRHLSNTASARRPGGDRRPGASTYDADDPLFKNPSDQNPQPAAQS